MMNMKAFAALYGISLVFIFAYCWVLSLVVKAVEPLL
jgi:hypothetical protein